MKNMMIAAAAALATIAVPASAQTFTGPRVEVTAGVDDVTRARDTSDVTYGINAGIDTPLLDSNLRVGVEVSTDNVFDRDRDIGVSGRIGYVVTDNAMLYAKAGYANFRNIDFYNRATTLDGFRAGGGVELAVTDNIYGKFEYRYTDFNRDVGKHAGLVGVGIRF